MTNFRCSLRLGLFILGNCLLGMKCQEAMASPRFSIEKLPRPDDATYTLAFQLNDRGDVVGRFTVGEHDHVALWSDDGFIDFGAFGYVHAVGRAANNHGLIAGFIQEGPDSSHMWSEAVVIENGMLTRLGTLSGPADLTSKSFAIDVNDNRQIVGTAHSVINNAWSERGFLWENGSMRDIGVPPGCIGASATAINESGQIIGVAIPTMPQNTPIRPGYIWTNGSFEVLPMLPGASLCEPRDINNAGHVVGQFSSIGHHIPFFFDGNNVVQLPLPPGVTGAQAVEINDADQIVGYSDWGVPLLWENGDVFNLNDLIPDEYGPFDVGSLIALNNLGQIAFTENAPDYSSFLLTPLPEPGLVGLIAVLSAAAFSRRAARA